MAGAHGVRKASSRRDDGNAAAAQIRRFMEFWGYFGRTKANGKTGDQGGQVAREDPLARAGTPSSVAVGRGGRRSRI